MDHAGIIDSPPDHPHARAIALANVEIRSGIDAAAEGNLGRARVCARRAIGAYLQTIGASLAGDVGTNAMANLRYLQSADHLPLEHRRAAGRLSGGARGERGGQAISEDPLADAAGIINYFVRQASDSPDHRAADGGLR